ncbi:hypothetical protein N865_00220 [Intrasporangium oryzae NRRL B-24470]|uniref:Uncharacterized protein n=1 Tax=Intrasporangium oryzae NRRL B-24470 TaxID=1386089 RepID=W9GAF0_9MICO|nr:hypothetical protein N865_00220 [Intrasporangium oryzae NRRL B-24470]
MGAFASFIFPAMSAIGLVRAATALDPGYAVDLLVGVATRGQPLIAFGQLVAEPQKGGDPAAPC